LLAAGGLNAPAWEKYAAVKRGYPKRLFVVMSLAGGLLLQRRNSAERFCA
jgi:hypothetical protein